MPHHYLSGEHEEQHAIAIDVPPKSFIPLDTLLCEQEKGKEHGQTKENGMSGSRSGRRVIPSLPRPQTFHRQQSEKRDRLLEVPQTRVQRRIRSASTLDASTFDQSRIQPHSSAPDLLLPAHVAVGHAAKQADEQSNHDEPSDPTDDQIGEAGRDDGQNSEDDCPTDAEIQHEYEERWILNLSMHFKDRSNREKFFVTYAQSPNKWRRLTISLDYRNAPPESLEYELSELHFQRDKSFRIFDALRESLPDIQFYDTVTNLKLETTPEDGQLHVHVREDANEIIEYPAASLMNHVSCERYSESQLDFESHISGFVYKVRINGRLMIKKEIPGPNSIDEFLYELNALNALQGRPNVVQLQGLVIDDKTSSIRGLLISYASRGALMDVLYDTPEEEISLSLRQKWATQVIRGLSEIHEAGYVQGDFTLSNIVIDADEDAFIIDINRRGCPVGWEPPELSELIENGQRISMLIGVKTDLYQLGMVLWALAECNDEPERRRPLPQIRANLPQLQQAINICLSERPQDRVNAQALLQEFNDRRLMFSSVDSISSAERATFAERARQYRSKDYIDPDLVITLDEVHSRNHHVNTMGPVRTNHFDSRPGSSSYRLESSGSWDMSRHRGRRLPTGQASFSAAATSATSVSPERLLCDSDDEIDGTTATMTALAMRHQDSGFDERMVADIELEPSSVERDQPVTT